MPFDYSDLSELLFKSIEGINIIRKSDIVMSERNIDSMFNILSEFKCEAIDEVLNSYGYQSSEGKMIR